MCIFLLITCVASLIDLEFISCPLNLFFFRSHKMEEMPMPSFMNKTLGELRVGTYKNICTVTEDTPIITALNYFVEHRVSALPILDASGIYITLTINFTILFMLVRNRIF